MTYTFRLMREPGAKFPAYAAIPIEDAEDGGLVRGMLPNSKEELMVARALDAAGLNYDYQVPLQGGRRSVAGGLVLDFL